jgi:lipoate-protein ligase A
MEQPYAGDPAILQQLLDSPRPWTTRIWEQEELCVVLGKGCKIDSDLKIDSINEQKIPVYRREGGGGTVVLSPGMVIVAFACHVRDPFGSKRFFRLIQQPMQEHLDELGLPGVDQLGLSDLALKGRKILGSSMRRKGSLLLYQAVMMVDCDRRLFEALLKHPPREPDYREGRGHDDFTITLAEAGLTCTASEFAASLTEVMDRRLPELLGEDLLTAEEWEIRKEKERQKLLK